MRNNLTKALVASAAKSKRDETSLDYWLEEHNLILIQGLLRDGCSYGELANEMGIKKSTLYHWLEESPEFALALRDSRDVIDYKVENALLKAALGHPVTEVKTTTVMRRGIVVEQTEEVTNREEPPSVAAIKMWLMNRRPDKWRPESKISFEDMLDDSSIHIEVTKATDSSAKTEVTTESPESKTIEMRKATPEEKKEAKEKKKEENKGRDGKGRPITVVEEEEDLDYWPDDWEEEDDI